MCPNLIESPHNDFSQPIVVKANLNSISKRKWFKVSWVLILLLLPSLLFCQQRKELEARRKRLINEIRVTTDQLNETKKTQEVTLDRYLTLKRQIQNRRQLIQTLQKEIQVSTARIERSTEVIESLTEDVKRLKEEYGQLLRSAYRQKLNQTDLLFIFSASSFNEAYRRWQYLKQYDNYRQKQARLISDTQASLSSKINQLEASKEEKQNLLESEERQTWLLEREMNAKNKMLENLKEDEVRLASDLESKEKAHGELNNIIERMIRREMAKRRKEERTATTAPKKERELPRAENLSNAFYDNQGKLPWPVKSGVISGKFGKQPHPTLKNVQVNNNGIDIQTDRNAVVRAVFGGIVAGVADLPGNNKVIMIRHGNYFTVYSNLEETLVKENQIVKIRDQIGKVGVNSRTRTSELHFEIWKNKTKLNPTGWIAKR